MNSWKFVAALLTGAAISAVLPAELRSNSGKLSAQDYAEIHQLYARYYWLADMSPGEKWAKELFTPDGVWWTGDDKGGEQAVGTQQLAEISVRKAGSLPRNRPQHMCTNISIEPAPEGAHGRCYLVFLLNPPLSGKTPTLAATGSYDDIIVKTPAGWRFKQRKHYQGMLPPAEDVLRTSN
jgi:hypothetical protein